MAKKKRQNQTQKDFQTKQDDESITLQDQLNSNVLIKLKEAKKSLVAEEQAKEEERQAQLAFERKQREKNMSFEELLEKYGDKGSKY